MVPTSPTAPRSDGPKVPPPFKGGTGGTNPGPDAADQALDLLSAAMVAKLAGTLGAPRLAVKAARRAGELADALVIGLSPSLARVTPAAEALALDGVRTTSDLCALLRPEVDDEPEGVS
jgi:hypothetical protein